jgi:hypothetical protein
MTAEAIGVQEGPGAVDYVDLLHGCNLGNVTAKTFSGRGSISERS